MVSPLWVLVFLFCATWTGVPVTAAPNLTLTGSAIASAHAALLEKLLNRVGHNRISQTRRALYG